MSDQQAPRELLKDYMETNDFQSGLRHKYIYTDEIIVGWIENTFLYAYGLQEKENSILKEKLEIATTALESAYMSLADCASRVKSPEPYMFQEIKEALEKIKELDRGGV